MTKSNPYIVICDIDGTLADCNHRRPHIMEKNPKDWKTFNRLMGEDRPVTALIEHLNLLASHDHVQILLVSGREEVYRGVTESWLLHHSVPYDELLMRAKEDYRDDDIIKEEILMDIRLKYGEPNIVFEDRDRLVKMWRHGQGIFTCQVAEGNF